MPVMEQNAERDSGRPAGCRAGVFDIMLYTTRRIGHISMQTDLKYIEAVWTSLGILWVAASLSAKPAARTEPAAGRVFHLVTLAAAFCLLLNARLSVGPLAWRVIPDSAGGAYAGLALTLAGAGFAMWARFYLGRNWSASVTIKQDHELVRSGPYAVVRHPIYSGLLLAMIGTAIAVGEMRGALGIILALIGWRTKYSKEEAFMTAQFGADYLKYKREVKALIPFVL